MEKLALNVTEVSEVLGVSKPVVYQLMRRDDFPSFFIGKRRLVPLDKLKEWVLRQADNNGGVTNG